MKFIKISEDRYLLKDSQNKIYSKKEMLELKEKNILIEEITSNECQKENHEELIKVKKELNEINGKTKDIKKTKQVIK